MFWKKLKPIYTVSIVIIVIGALLMLFWFASSAYLLRFEPDSGANIGGGLALMASIPILLIGLVTALVGIVMDLAKRKTHHRAD